MSIATISAAETQQKLAQGAILIDIRELDEYRREHIAQAVQTTVKQMLAAGLPECTQTSQTIIFHCKGGVRTQQAAATLAQIAANKQCFILENGIEGWKKAGFATQQDRSQPLELMRQVQIVAGSLALGGTLLGWFVTPEFYAVPAFVGAGLLTAGITGFCGMAKLLAVMPWNRP